MTTLDQLWEDVSLSGCRICVDHVNGKCGLADPNRCVLKAQFARVVDVVASVRDDSFPPYVVALRENVCAECEHALSGGRCITRDNVDCALDRYYPIIIGTIEESLHGTAA
jgi:hypothetical protein